MSDSCFLLKGSVFTTLVLELRQYSAATFASELRQKIEQAPQLLLQSPVILIVDKCSDLEGDIDFDWIVRQCRDLGLQPLGFRSCPRFDDALRLTGLPLLPASSGRGGSPIREEPAASLSSEASRAQAPLQQAGEDRRVRAPSRVVTQPVRSGQQIYARDCDLIVLSQVSEGAEVLADGNIHIYGGLRGRALAGVAGDVSARIFCHSLEAELLSVAGNFLLSEDFREQLWKKPVQVSLNEESLCIDPL
jgi:septum site-determining protein MinC